MSNIPSQARSIYQLLSRRGPLSAKEIAQELGILPNAVYRSANILVEFGFIQTTDGYPTKYGALSSSDGIDKYLQSLRYSLSEMIFPNKQASNLVTQLDVVFIDSRSDLLEKSNIDIGNTTKEACFIVSGLEVPAETMLAYKQALGRGIHMRIIIQNLDETKRDMLTVWKQMRIQVRHFPLIEARILIFDSKIAYLTSYNPSEQEIGTGVRFNYPPIATIMRQLFEQRWAKAKEIET
ncbi:HTH domain-containing protein [Candidatus Woesebacteria bacterium]|nr:HTH domain-containing protein [Candidatus Woesebacteria bacterium]